MNCASAEGAWLDAIELIIWNEIKSGRGAEAALTRILELYRVDRRSAYEDLEAFTRDLTLSGFVLRRYSESPSISVIIPVLNGASSIAETIRHVLDQDWPPEDIEIIAIDNNSTDNTAEILSELPVTYVFCSLRNRGAARNLGARVARGKVLAFLDCDSRPRSDWLKRSLARLERGASAVQSTITCRNEPVGYSTEPFHLHLPLLDTGGCIVTRAAFDRTEGFDEELNSQEDLDLTWRLLVSGAQIEYFDETAVECQPEVNLAALARRAAEIGAATALVYSKWQLVLRSSYSRLLALQVISSWRKLIEGLGVSRRAVLGAFCFHLFYWKAFLPRLPLLPIYRFAKRSELHVAPEMEWPVSRLGSRAIRPSSSLRIVFIGREAVALDLSRPALFDLNETSAWIARLLLEGGVDLEQAASDLSRTSTVTVEQALADIRSFVSELEAEGLVVEAEIP